VRYPGEIAREAYDAHPGVRWSLLSNMRKSPLHYQHALENRRTETTALRTGSALHTLVFEPELYEQSFTVYRESKTKGEGSKKRWELFQAEAVAKGLTILDSEEEARALGMSAAIAKRAAQFIAPSRGRAEIPLTWKDERTGLLCKCRLDWVTLEGMIIELKSTRSAEVRAFGRQAWNLGYFHQVHHYSTGFGAATGCEPDKVPILFVAVESEPPHDVSLFEPCAETRYAAKEETDKLMDTLAECRRTNKWPGRYDKVEMLSAPKYVLMSEDEEWEVNAREAK
jgi:hypothetical protein